MSWQRYQRGVRALGGFAGGTSRLARPPAVLPEPDRKPGGRCPTLVATHSHGSPAGLSADGSLLYTAEVSDLDVLNFPALTSSSTVDLTTAMDALGAGGGGSIQVATIDDSGYLYAAAYVTSSTNIQLFKVLLDGTGEDMLWTAGQATSTADDYSIGWHTADPDYIYLLYALDAGGARLVKIHRTTGAETLVDTFADGYFRNRFSLTQWDDGFVFFVGDAGPPASGDIWVYGISADASDSLATSDSFGGLGTRPDGYTLWGEDSLGAGGDQGIHAFTIEAGPTIVESGDVCTDGWDTAGGYDPPIYWFANPNRTLVYVSSGVNVWQWT